MHHIQAIRSSHYRKLLHIQKTENGLKMTCWSSWGKSQLLAEILLMSFERVTVLRELLEMAIGFASKLPQQIRRCDLIKTLPSTVSSNQWLRRGGRGVVPIKV